MKVLFISLFLFFHLRLIADFPIVELKDINLTKCKLVKAAVGGGQSRSVYYSPEEKLFLKIWEKKFWRCTYFLQGLKNKFYDEENTPLVAIIYEGSLCRGYVTRAGVGLGDIALTGKRALLPISQQKHKLYIDFYTDLLERTNLLGYAYVDLTPLNITLEDDKIKIIDLEPLLPIKKVDASFFNSKAYPSDYRSYIKRLKYGKKVFDEIEYKAGKNILLYLYYSN